MHKIARDEAVLHIAGSEIVVPLSLRARSGVYTRHPKSRDNAGETKRGAARKCRASERISFCCLLKIKDDE